MYAYKSTEKKAARNLLIRASYGELAGPEELAVGLLPLTEPLYCPGKSVLHILTNLCPAKID